MDDDLFFDTVGTLMQLHGCTLPQIWQNCNRQVAYCPWSRSALSAADQWAWVRRYAADAELEVQMRTNRETRAADIPDLPALLNVLPNGHGRLRHVGVHLHQAEAVGDLNPDPVIVRVTGCAHSSAGSRDDRRAGLGQ